MVTRRKSSEVFEEWKPKPEHSKLPEGMVAEYNFSRVKEENFQGLTGAAKDNSYEAKAIFGLGDTYGDWSN